MAAYYNDSDKFICAWLRELIKAGLIADGEVDERSITDVQPEDVRGFVQCHFFAGIGGWSYALRLAGWPDDRPIWTGSCPCQPYSVATGLADQGAEGQTDSRHLWPSWFPLIRECAPVGVLGEQVRSAIGWHWWDEAQLDLEEAGYSCAPLVLRADAFGAEHERKRLYWLADAGGQGREGHQPIESLSVATAAPQPVNGDAPPRARLSLESYLSGLLLRDGVSVQLERDALRGFGNAIHAPTAAAFVSAYMEIR